MAGRCCSPPPPMELLPELFPPSVARRFGAGPGLRLHRRGGGVLLAEQREQRRDPLRHGLRHVELRTQRRADARADGAVVEAVSELVVAIGHTAPLLLRAIRGL